MDKDSLNALHKVLYGSEWKKIFECELGSDLSNFYNQNHKDFMIDDILWDDSMDDVTDDIKYNKLKINDLINNTDFKKGEKFKSQKIAVPLVHEDTQSECSSRISGQHDKASIAMDKTSTSCNHSHIEKEESNDMEMMGPILLKQESYVTTMIKDSSDSCSTNSTYSNNTSKSLYLKKTPASKYNENLKKKDVVINNSPHKKIRKLKSTATSQFKGVTRHRVTGKYEAHLWDASVIRNNKNRRGRKRGKQIYLGGFLKEIQAARTYDMAAICFWGENAILNFPLEDYTREIEFLQSTDKETIVKILRRNYGGFINGSNEFKGIIYTEINQRNE